MSTILRLAREQLVAYNTAQLEPFAACYHPEVEVFREEELSFRGRDVLRERYRDLFERWAFGAAVPERLHLGGHCVDFETWWRVNPDNGQRSTGTMLARYQEGDGLIARVQFLGG
jgi:hypothetical protein